ncbi:MAG: Acetyltransferase Pat [Syntrophorhabdus sp. PtaU1.Bin153]|nr:MAG: Acetyltransferase Pat [Syntrophorhabdus sp. PtaU1.Bin153]
MNRNEIMSYKVTEHLRNQQAITIRAVSPDDKGLVIEALADLSADSIYRRFFTFKQNISPKGLKQVTEVDFHNAVALVAVLEKDGTEQLAGGGRYIRSGLSKAEEKAEVAFLVHDAFQGLGIGSIILKHLVAIARESGITEFEAEVLPSNEAMLKVFTRSGLPVVRRATRESIQVSIKLVKE